MPEHNFVWTYHEDQKMWVLRYGLLCITIDYSDHGMVQRLDKNLNMGRFKLNSD